MRRYVLVVILFFNVLVLLAQQRPIFPVSHVDKRVELISIACRLANINGFNDAVNTVYIKAIDTHFKKFSGHPFVQYLSSFKQRLDTAYWEVLALAVHINQPPALKPLLGYNDTAWVDMWEDRTMFNEKIVLLLQSFYRETRCATFFASQQLYYNLVKQQYERKAVRVNYKWVQNFLGIGSTENYCPIIALGIHVNYGAYMRVNYPSNHRDTYTIFTSENFNKNGVPGNFSDLMYYRSILHEYIHSYTNQLVDKNISALQKPAEILIANPKVYKLMKNTFYGNWQYLLYESLVRALVIKYIVKNDSDKHIKERETIKQETLGFFWMKGLVQQLDVYESRRSEYKSIAVFMPEIIRYFGTIANDIK